MTTTTATSTTDQTLPEDGRLRPANAPHDWAAHAQRLTRHPGEWLMLEPDLATGTVAYLRSGKQRDFAPLLGHLTLRMSDSRQVRGTRRGQVWGKYDPDAPAETATPVLTDAQVRDLRTRYATKQASQTALAAEYDISQTYVSNLVRGTVRVAAGGPTTRNRPALANVDITRIRDAYAQGGVTHAQLAHTYDVSQSYISAIIRGERRN